MLSLNKIYSSRERLFNFIAVVIALLALYQYRYGLGILNPVNDAWLIIHDWAQHYLAWFFYRNEPWTFPIGNISNWWYPMGTNVGFTDSIPLAAIFFKVFSPILPHNFQYLGWWLFASHALLGYFTIRLLDLFGVRGPLQLVATLIVVFNPVLLHRSIHPALCSHWVIMASFWVYFLDPARYTATRLLWFQGIIFIIGSLINPYLSLIGAGFFAALAWRLWWFDKSLTFSRALISATLAFAMLFILWYSIGFFSFKNKVDLGVSGAYGLYAFNLNSLFNSGGWSSILVGRPTISWHQYESYMYLGVGVIALICFVTVGSIANRFARSRLQNQDHSKLAIRILPLGLFIFIASMFAITNVITFDDKVLFTISVPGNFLKVADIFRASARYFWVFYYGLVIFVIIQLTRMMMHLSTALIILVIVFVVQLYDYQLLLRSGNVQNYGRYKTPLTESKWRKMFEKLDRFEFYPPMQTDYASKQDYRYFSYLAADYSKPINLGYTARFDNKVARDYEMSFRREIDNGSFDGKALYISTPEYAGRFTAAYQDGKLGFGQLDGYYFFYSKELQSDPVFVGYADSAPEELKKRRTFSPYKISAAAIERNWSLNVFRMERSPKVLFLKTSVPKEVQAKNMSLSVLLLSKDNEAYLSDPVAVSKGIVQSDSILEFRGTFFTEGLKDGNYRIALLSQPSGPESGVAEYGFIGNLNVGLGVPYEPKEVNEIQRMKWWLEVLDTRDEKNVVVGGWAFLEDQPSLPNRVEILLKSDARIYVVPTDVVPRPDVVAYFNSAVNVETCGFLSWIDKTMLAPGEYEVGIRITNDNARLQGTEYTGGKFNIP